MARQYLGALSVSDFAQRRRAFEGSLLDVTFVAAANAYRAPEGVAAADLALHLAAELEGAITSLGPERVAAFIFEPIVGRAGGVVPAPEGYAQAIQAVCRKHDVLMIADEVMCGAGRTGSWRALEHEGVVPDIMSIAKGLAGGYIPLGATLVTPRVAAPIHSEHGTYMTGQTFTGHTAACAAALAVQQIIERDAWSIEFAAPAPSSNRPSAARCPNSTKSAMCAAADFSSASNWFATRSPKRRFRRSAR
jgi:adenosylmethionine-8-amino-7-oxononanoate aminotransferase